VAAHRAAGGEQVRRDRRHRASEVRPRLEILPYVTGGSSAYRSTMAIRSTSSLAGGAISGSISSTAWGRRSRCRDAQPRFRPGRGRSVERQPVGNELFFAEKPNVLPRGSDLFKLPIGNGDNPIEGAFYSRRIGAAPPEPDDHDFLKAPQSTTIYGAAKLTARPPAAGRSACSNAVTGRESAEVVFEDVRSTPVVAPLTNYAIARIKRDLGDGKTSIGVSATAVHRKLEDTGLEATLHDQATPAASSSSTAGPTTRGSPCQPAR